MKAKIFLIALAVLIWTAPLYPAPIMPLELKNSRPHDPARYTQGLFFHQGRLFESIGRYGRSALISQSFSPPRPNEQPLIHELAARYFAEGADLAEGEIYLLTWQEQTGFVLDPETLTVKRQFSYHGEGWGLAWDGRRLWRSDGSARLRPHRPGDFAPDGEPLTVTDEGREISQINELEWDPVTSLMLANIYGQDLVAAIDLNDGRVRFWLDARPLAVLARSAGLPDTGNPMDTVLNGLALGEGGLWLTGKLWPRLYQVTWPPTEVKEKSD